MQTNKQLIFTICILWLVFVSITLLLFYIIHNQTYYFVILLFVLGLFFMFLSIASIDSYLKTVHISSSDIVIDELPYQALHAHELVYGQYDKLTSLPNRILFNRILNRALNHAKRHGKILAILVIGIDGFKDILRSVGKQKTDLIIKEVSSRLINILRTNDIIARLDNDEFIILLNDINNVKFAGSVAEKILYSSKEPLKISDQNILITYSIGISIFPNDGDSLESLLGIAESSLYNARTSHGNRYKYHTTKMDSLTREYIELENSLRRAIDKHELVLYFQPQYKLADATIESAEALIRWTHPKYGIMNPSQFIPLAEETDLITIIGEWTLHEACRMNKHWQNLGYKPITIAVNISIKELQKDLCQIVKDAIEINQLNPELIEIEITESEIIKNPELTLSEISKINQLGVHIAIDDFGSGYTSINYLRQFPLHTLKIDQSLVKQVEMNKKDQAITKSIIELGHSLGLNVIAEGVESIEQVIFLARYRCDYVQGYFFSRPLPEHKFIELLTKIK